MGSSAADHLLLPSRGSHGYWRQPGTDSRLCRTLLHRRGRLHGWLRLALCRCLWPRRLKLGCSSGAGRPKVPRANARHCVRQLPPSHGSGTGACRQATERLRRAPRRVAHLLPARPLHLVALPVLRQMIRAQADARAHMYYLDRPPGTVPALPSFASDNL